MILLALIFFLFRPFRKKPAMSLNAAGPGSFSEPGMAYSSLPVPGVPSAPALQVPPSRLQHFRNTAPAINESNFLTFNETLSHEKNAREKSQGFFSRAFPCRSRCRIASYTQTSSRVACFFPLGLPVWDGSSSKFSAKFSSSPSITGSLSSSSFSG